MSTIPRDKSPKSERTAATAMASPWWYAFGNTIQAFPREIVPSPPDFMNCDGRYGEGLKIKDCKWAVAEMPRAREGAQVEWGVNHQSARYTLPLTLNGKEEGKPWPSCPLSIGCSAD